MPGAVFDGAGQNTQPGAYVQEQTIATGVSTVGGVQRPILMGEGSRFERIVVQALGGGKDGWNSTFTSSNVGTDGRHFKTTFAPVQSNRYTVFKNGIPLVGLEQEFNSKSGGFSSLYDYRLAITEGWIELQQAALVDLGGTFFSKGSLNIGNGVINNLTLVDPDAPTETWTIRCSSVLRDGYGNPISGFARFIANGSVSGTLLDGYGNVVTWQSNNIVVSNGILSFSIAEGVIPFNIGDTFTVKVKGGALVKGDTLTIDYIAVQDLNDPEFFTDLNLLQIKHGSPDLNHPLSLGAQIAFANEPPGIWAIQTAPAVPRRISYVVEPSASGQVLINDLTFPLPLGVQPDTNSAIHFFITDPVTGIETQILPNKVAFYDPGFTTSPSSFCFSATLHYSYTVVLENSVTKIIEDGIVTSTGPTNATVSSPTKLFTANDVGKSLVIETPSSNAGTYTIISVANGIATIGGSSFVNETGREIQVIDNTATSAKILLTKDLVLTAGAQLRVTVVDFKDASFFDAGWSTALSAMEKIDSIDIVVPLPTQTITAIFSTCLAHCNAMSSIKARRERRLYIGAIRGLTPDNLIGNKLAAVEDIGVLEGIQGDTIQEILAGNIEDLANYSVSAAYGNTFRVVYYYPDEIVVQFGSTRAKVDGFYLAAAGAGFVASLQNPVVPQTAKVLRGFTILSNKLLAPSVIDDLLGAGVAVVQPVVGGGEVIWGLTTTQSGAAEEQEDSIVAVRDIIAKAVRRTMKVFTGQPPDPSTQGTLMSKFDLFLKGLVAAGYIDRYKDVRVSQNAIEPREWDFTASIRPRYPINWEYIKIFVGNV